VNNRDEVVGLAEFSLQELKSWNSRIEGICQREGLDCYNQEFEICSYEEMICYEAYIGMPSHYPHWSYGKTYEKIKTLHKYNLTGLPYEMVINSDPCMAYLMKDNTLLLQILTMAHVYGHNDFFKNNRLFRDGTNAKYTIEMFKNQANRIREYIQDPSIGYDKVEKILNAAHAIKYQTQRITNERSLGENEKFQRFLDKSNNVRSSMYPLLEPKEDETKVPAVTRKIPLSPEEDVLKFIITYGRLEDWEKDILSIVRQETMYFIPQIETKIMNEGWASFWHYRILNELSLSQDLHFEFLKRHNQVIKPLEGQINPYYIGFKIFEDVYKKYGKDKLFEIREIERDQSFIRRYLTRELCEETHLFEYIKLSSDYIVSEISDEQGWKKVRDSLSDISGLGSIPVIVVDEWQQKDNTLFLRHIYDGRELEFTNAYETLKHAVDLWGGKVALRTTLDEKEKTLICDESRKVTMMNGT